MESNREKGLGRPDILLKDDDNRRVLIIETKKVQVRGGHGRRLQAVAIRLMDGK